MIRANRAQFSDLSLRHINEDEPVPELALPSVQGEEDAIGIDGLEPVGEPEYTDAYISPDQLEGGLLTLTLLPRSRWQTLLNLDVIRVSQAQCVAGER
jgi:U3 small nucleolar RNA-associated protein 21